METTRALQDSTDNSNQRGDPDWPRLQGPLDKWGHLNVRRTSDPETVKEPKVPQIPTMLVVDDDFNEIGPYKVIMGVTQTEARKALKKAKEEHVAKKAAKKASEASAGATRGSKSGRSTRSNTGTKASGKRIRPEASQDSRSDNDEPIRKRGRPVNATKAPAKPKKAVRKSTRRPPAKPEGKGKAPPQKVRSSDNNEAEQTAAAPPTKDPTEPSPRRLRPRKRDAK